VAEFARSGEKGRKGKPSKSGNTEGKITKMVKKAKRRGRQKGYTSTKELQQDNQQGEKPKGGGAKGADSEHVSEYSSPLFAGTWGKKQRGKQANRPGGAKEHQTKK